MKLVKNLVFAGLLISAISLNTFAGEQEIPAYIPPPPPRAVADEGLFPVVSEPYLGQSGETKAETANYLFYEALAALLSVY